MLGSNANQEKSGINKYASCVLIVCNLKILSLFTSIMKPIYVVFLLITFFYLFINEDHIHFCILSGLFIQLDPGKMLKNSSTGH